MTRASVQFRAAVLQRPRLIWPLGALGLLALLSLLTACGKSSATQSDAVKALRSVGAYQAGEPAMVFVYTDG